MLKTNFSRRWGAFLLVMGVVAVTGLGSVSALQAQTRGQVGNGRNGDDIRPGGGRVANIPGLPSDVRDKLDRLTTSERSSFVSMFQRLSQRDQRILVKMMSDSPTDPNGRDNRRNGKSEKPRGWEYDKDNRTKR